MSVISASMMMSSSAPFLPGLILNVSGLASSTITKTYQNLAITGSGTSGTKIITANSSAAGLVQAGELIRIAGTDIYTVSSVSTVTINTVENLTNNYVTQALALDKISQWNDLSSRINNISQATAANQFVYNPTGINSVAAVMGNGSVTVEAFTNTITLSNDLSIFWVAKAASLAAGGGIIGATPSTSKISVNNADPTKFGIVVVNGGSVDGTIAHPSVGTSYIGMLNRNTSNKVDLSINNAAASRLYADVAQSGDMVLTRVGRDNVPLSFNGAIGQILIYNRALSTTEASQVFKYLSNIWGIAI